MFGVFCRSSFVRSARTPATSSTHTKKSSLGPPNLCSRRVYVVVCCCRRAQYFSLPFAPLPVPLLPSTALSLSLSLSLRPSPSLSLSFSRSLCFASAVPSPPRRRRPQTLATDEHSNVLIYMNGHGGDQFLKFHDMEEVSSHDLGGALREMELKKRYHRVCTT